MHLEPVRATSANIEKAAVHLRQGDLVAFPTETVYGLGADARNDAAVAAIFAAKGRPSFNPLIIHVADMDAAHKAAKVTAAAAELAGRFWPGGLTMVLERHDGDMLSARVTAGLASVAVRIPSHRVALALLRAAACPIAAPSANRSGHVSATTAAHVAADFDKRSAPTLAMILDDGPCPLGLESTIIDMRGSTPRLLRPGAVTLEALEAVLRPLGQQIVTVSVTPNSADAQTPRSSPGQLESHYAPSKPVLLDVTEPQPGHALLAFGPPPSGFSGEMINLSATSDLAEASANLFAALRYLDRSAAIAIAVMPIPSISLGRAINDRLQRAAAPRPPNA